MLHFFFSFPMNYFRRLLWQRKKKQKSRKNLQVLIWFLFYISFLFLSCVILKIRFASDKTFNVKQFTNKYFFSVRGWPWSYLCETIDGSEVSSNSALFCNFFSFHIKEEKNENSSKGKHFTSSCLFSDLKKIDEKFSFWFTIFLWLLKKLKKWISKRFRTCHVTRRKRNR